MSYSRPLTNVVGMTSLKVENLSKTTLSATLKLIFEDYGTVHDVQIPRNPLTEEPYGFAFVNFHNKCDAESALNALNGIFLDGCKLRVQMVNNSDPQYTQSICGQGGQYHYKEDNHEFQSHRERHSCHTTRIQSRSHSCSFPEQSEYRARSHCSHKRLPSTKRSKSSSSTSSHQLQDKPHPETRNLPERKKPKSRSSPKHDFKCSETRGKNIKNQERKTEITNSDLIFLKSYQSEESRSETMTARSHTARSRKTDLPKKGAFDKSEEDPFHDIVSYQPTTFQQYEVTAEEEKECQSWTGTSRSKAQNHTLMEGESNNDNSEVPGLKHDHLYFARLLGEQNMNNQNEMENAQSKSIFKNPSRSKANVTDTLVAVPSNRSQISKRHRSPPNWGERPWREEEHMGNNQRQTGNPQSDSVFKNASEPDDDVFEVPVVYNRFPERTRRRTPRISTTNDLIICEAKPLDGVPRGDSKRGHPTSFQQAKRKTKRRRSHDSNRNGQKRVDHQQPESTCVCPVLTEESIPEIFIEDTFTSDRSIRSESPECVIVGEIPRRRSTQPIQHVNLLNNRDHVSPETFSHLTMHESLSSVRPGLPLRDDLNISEFQRSSSQRRKRRKRTAHTGQSTFTSSTNAIPVKIDKKEHTNIFLHSNQASTHIIEIISDDETSNTDLNFTAPNETSGQIMTEIFEEHANSIPIDVEAYDSSSRRNRRRVYSGDRSIPRSVSSSTSHSTSNNTVHPVISSSGVSQQVLPIPTFMDNTNILERSLHVLFQMSEDSNEPIILTDDPFMVLQGTRVTNQEHGDNGPLPSLPDFANFNNINNNHPKGLTKEQINTLPMREFCKDDKVNICSICITEYTESSKIRILPCSHEYHDECIDHWLLENDTCPICRSRIIHPDDTEILF